MRVFSASLVMRVVIPALLVCTTSASGQQLPPPGPKVVRSAVRSDAAKWPRLTTSQRSALSAVRADIEESEPNDSVSVATVVRFGDVVSGTLGVPDDVDWFAIDLEAGDVVELEVFAQREGSAMDSYMVLVDPDGNTVAFNDDLTPGSILDSRIRYGVPAAGRYHAALVDYYCIANLPQCSGGPTYTYKLHVREAIASPGDPTTMIAQNLGSPWGAAAAPNGDLFIADQEGRVIRITAAGVVSTYATNIGAPYDVVIDAVGDLLVAGELTATTSGVTRIKPDGTRSTFVTGLQSATAITVGPDGDVWVANPASRRLHRYSYDGVAKTPVDMPTINSGLLDIAFSPTGVLHVADFATGVFRIVNNAAVRHITFSGGQPGGLVFDRDGYLYLGSAANGVVMYDPAGTVMHSPFAEFNLDLPANMVFGRDASGAMTNRLYVINYGAVTGSVFLLNTAGVRAPGFRIGVDLLLFAQDSVKPGVMGAPYSHTLRLTNAMGAVAWSVQSGTVPPGLALTQGGIISGIPETTGTFSFVVRALGSGGRFGTHPVTINVTRPTLSMNDAANHLLGVSGVLSEDLLRFLDLQGNKNGRFDAGDLQTYLRAEGRIR